MHDLRAEVDDDAWVDNFKADWRTAGLSAADTALMAYAERLTRAPWEIRRGDLDDLRGAGLADDQISDAAQVIAYFNYINRIADGLGVDLEDSMPPDPREAG
ncbi:MAG: hypothetical protein QF463_04765 [Vicinamibacterales bacterium]|nr:hypothetical protein [Vicinamibacterales bacterium]MDP6608359.1 hypothetical protein [Vicinamibacterales bacterium]